MRSPINAATPLVIRFPFVPSKPGYWPDVSYKVNNCPLTCPGLTGKLTLTTILFPVAVVRVTVFF